jgi:hypothetical protein
VPGERREGGDNLRVHSELKHQTVLPPFCAIHPHLREDVGHRLAVEGKPKIHREALPPGAILGVHNVVNDDLREMSR